MSTQRIERTERLLNLVFCLMSARRAVHRAAIRDTVPGYGDAPSDAAFERTFERDKDELRQMGIPIETVLDAHGDVEGYRIRPDQYALEPLAFTSPELAVIALAAGIWQEATMRSASVVAVRKLDAHAGAQAGAEVRTAASETVAVSVRLGAASAVLQPVLQSLRLHRPLRFDYRAANQQPVVTRTIDPWGAVAYDGRWFVVGHDRDRNAPRAFRMTRIVGVPKVLLAEEMKTPRPLDADLRALVAGRSDAGAVVARIRVAAGRAAGLRAVSTTDLPFDADGVVQVEGLDLDHVAALVRAAGDGADVQEPPELAAAVRAGLEAVLAAHAGAGS